ncbi:MAG: DUF1573 domain-containing protein [Bacillota bacterium]
MHSKKAVVYAGICCITLITGMALLGLAGVLDPSGHEPIVIKARHDFGFVHPGQTMQHRFTLANSWKRPLRIQRIRVDCGCTSTTLGKSAVAPGQETTIDIAIQTKDYPERRRFQVLAEGEMGRSKVTFLFEMLAQSANVIDFSPSVSSISFGDCPMGQLPQRGVLEVQRGTYPLPWDTLECHSADPMLGASLTPKGPDRWQLELAMNRPEAYGAFRGELEFVFKSNGTEQPYRYRVPVDANIVGPVVATPASLLIGAIGCGAQVVRRIRIERREDRSTQPLEILSVATADDGCVMAQIKQEAGQPWIEAVFTGPRQEGPRSGIMVVTVKADRIYKINIGYLMLVVPSVK